MTPEARAKERLEKYRADRGSLEAVNNLWFSLNEMLAVLAASQERVRELTEACVEGLELDGMVRWCCRLCGDMVFATLEDDGPGLLHVDSAYRKCLAALRNPESPA